MSTSLLTVSFAVLADSGTSSLLFLKTSNLADKIAVAVTVLSLSLWASRHLYIELKKRRVPSLPELVRPIFLLLRKTHPVWGWIIFVTATIHALYYFLPLEYFNRRMLTGIIAWAVLALLVVLGLRYQSILRKKILKKYVRSPHVLVAMAFVVAAGVHILLHG